jgi:hypothetical protein
MSQSEVLRLLVVRSYPLVEMRLKRFPKVNVRPDPLPTE